MSIRDQWRDDVLAGLAAMAARPAFEEGIAIGLEQVAVTAGQVEALPPATNLIDDWPDVVVQILKATVSLESAHEFSASQPSPTFSIRKKSPGTSFTSILSSD
jgi:hypothetical protein